MPDLKADKKTQAARSSLLIVSVDTRHVPLFQLALPEYNIREKILSGAERAEVDFSGERADLIILDCLKLSDFTIEVVEQLLSRICAPLIVFADQSDEGHGQKAMRAGASACIIDGLHEHRIRPLIAIAKERFRMMSEVTEELKRTRDSLSARKTIERAKGYIMEQKGLSEAEAYTLMRRQAMSRAVSLKEIAQNILNVSDLLKS